MITIETDRLILRPYTLDDLDMLAPILGDPITMRFWPRPMTRDEACGWIERSLASYAEHGFGRWPVLLRESGGMIGDCGLFRKGVNGRMTNDLGYIFHHPWWGKGYAIEAATAVADYAFDELGLDELVANMAHDNDPSRRVAERLGMMKLGEFDNEMNRGIRTLVYRIGNEKADQDERAT